MLELRPTCENCNTPLPPASAGARICSHECTFCAQCVDTLLANVCPNCGGGFVARPIRPAHEWRAGTHLGARPATTQVTHNPVDAAAHARFAAPIRDIAPGER